LKGHNMLGW